VRCWEGIPGRTEVAESIAGHVAREEMTRTACMILALRGSLEAPAHSVDGSELGVAEEEATSGPLSMTWLG
jgi:hypothetical protein